MLSVLHFYFLFRFRCSSPCNSLPSSGMYPAGCSRPATDLSRCLPNLKQRSNRQAYRWCSSENSFVQVWKQAKSRRASDRLLPVLLYIQLGQNHVHSHGRHAADTDVRQDMARTVHQAWGSLRWWKRHKIRIWFWRVFTYQESVWLRCVSVKEECVIGGNLLGIVYFLASFFTFLSM